MHRIRRTYADKGIKVLLLPSCHMPFAATPSHALSCSLLMHTCNHCIGKPGCGCREELHKRQADDKPGLCDSAGLLPWWHCHRFPADDKLGVQAGLY